MSLYTPWGSKYSTVTFDVEKGCSMANSLREPGYEHCPWSYEYVVWEVQLKLIMEFIELQKL
jgi:hypothetical protein